MNDLTMIEIVKTCDNSSKMRCVICNASLQLLENGMIVSPAAEFTAFCEKHGACTDYAGAIPLHLCRDCGAPLEAIPTEFGDPEAAVLVKCSSCEHGFFGFFPSFDEARAAVQQAIEAKANAAWNALKDEPELLNMEGGC